MNYLIQIFIFVCIVASTCGLSLAQNTTIYVNPSSTLNYTTQCGFTIDTSCSTIMDAVNVFMNTSDSVKNASDATTIYSSLVIELFSGDYFIVNSTASKTTLPFYGFNVTIQPYPGQQITLNGVNRVDYDLFTAEPSNNNNLTLSTSVTFNNITFDSFDSMVLYDGSNTFQLYLNNCTIIRSPPLYYFIEFRSKSLNSSSSVSFDNLIFTKNQGDLLSIQNASVSFNNTIISENSLISLQSIRVASGSIILQNSILSNNTGTNYLIECSNSSITISTSTFWNNTGTLSLQSSFGNISTSYFILNAQVGLVSYGPIMTKYGYLTISNSYFTNNAGYYGGAIYADSTNLYISFTTFGDNTGVFGSAIYSKSNSMSISNSIMYYQLSTLPRFNPLDLIYLSNTTTISITNSTINVGSKTLSSSFKVIGCYKSKLYYAGNNIVGGGHDIVDCTECQINSPTYSNVVCSSDSDDNNSSNDHSHGGRTINPTMRAYYITSAVLLCFFSVLLIFALIFIIACYMRTRNQNINPDGYKLLS